MGRLSPVIWNRGSVAAGVKMRLITPQPDIISWDEASRELRFSKKGVKAKQDTKSDLGVLVDEEQGFYIKVSIVYETIVFGKSLNSIAMHDASLNISASFDLNTNEFTGINPTKIVALLQENNINIVSVE